MNTERYAWDSRGFLLWHASLRWQRTVTAALRPLGLTHVQFVLLAGVWWLEAQGRRPSQRELAEHAGTDPMMTSQVVRALERSGLVRREGDAADARIRRLRVTDSGRKLAVRAVQTVEAADRAYFAEVADQAALLDALRRLGGPQPPADATR